MSREPRFRSYNQAPVLKPTTEEPDAVMNKMQSFADFFLERVNRMEAENNFTVVNIGLSGHFPNEKEFRNARAVAYKALRIELTKLALSISKYKNQSFKTGTSPVATFPNSPLNQAKFYDQYVIRSHYHLVEPDFFNLIGELRSELESLVKVSQQSSQAHLMSYQEKSKSNRMARALIAEGYDEKYVTKALTDKGYSPQESLRIIKAGYVELYDEKIKSSRTVALVLGGLWLIVLVIFLATDNNPESTSADPKSGYIPVRFIAYGAILFIGSLLRWIYYYFKSAVVESA